MADVSFAGAPGAHRTEIPITHAHSRIRWGAVFAGLVVTLALQFILYLVGIGTGLAAFDVGDSGKPFGVGAAIWAVLVPLIALFIGGMTTGRLAGVLNRKDGFLHGVLTWSLAMLVGVVLLSRGIGAIAGTTFRLAGNVVGATAGAVAQGATAAVGGAVANANDGGGIDLASVRREVDEALRQTGNPALNPDSLRADANQAANAATSSGASNEQLANEIGGLFQDRTRQVSRDDLVNVIAARSNLSRPEAERLADRVQSLGQQARQQLGQGVAEVRESAGEVADQTATAAASGIWLALLGLGLSLGAAVLGTQRTARE